MANPIERRPTEAERMDFIPIAGTPGTRRNAMDKFNDKLGEEFQKAMKKGLPFAEKAARDEWMDHFEGEKKRLLRLYGYVKEDEVKLKEMDWEKFSDLSKFKLIKEGQTLDRHLTKRHSKEIFLKHKVYRFKGYSNKYRVMEGYPGEWDEKKNTVSSVQNDKQEKTKKLDK